MWIYLNIEKSNFRRKIGNLKQFIVPKNAEEGIIWTFL